MKIVTSSSSAKRDAKKYYELHKESIRKKAKKNYAKVREYHKRKNQEYHQIHRVGILARQKEYREKNREKLRMMQRLYGRELRLKVLTKLGLKCVRCGFSDIRVLEIDHINGGGTSERRTVFCYTILRRIWKGTDEEVKNKYQILCANCNAIKKYENKEN